MPANNRQRTQPSMKIQDATSPTISLEDIKRIAREAGRIAAREEVQSLLGDVSPAQPQPDTIHFIDEIAVPEPQTVISARPSVQIAMNERRFIAHLPPHEGEENEVRGTAHQWPTGPVVLDDAKGGYDNWNAFHIAFAGRNRTPTEIEWE